jgi:ribonuclease P protein component
MIPQNLWHQRNERSSNFGQLESKQRYTFKKEEKLKSRKAIDQLFKEGRSFSIFPFKVIWKLNETPTAVLQAGFAVSSKQFKKAVDRNRIKRLTREAYRLQKNNLQEHLKSKQKQLAVFFIYVGNELPEYSVIFDKTGAVIKRLTKIINENSLADT